MSQTQDSALTKDCTWTESEEQVLLEQAVIKGKVNWDDVAKLLPGKTSDDCRDHFNTVLNQREPTADEISKFRNLYLLNFDNVWKTSLQSPEGKPWENLTNRRTSTIKCDWYMRVRKTMWRSIAASVNCPWGVVEKMFLKLDEEERAGNMGVAVADL